MVATSFPEASEVSAQRAERPVVWVSQEVAALVSVVAASRSWVKFQWLKVLRVSQVLLGSRPEEVLWEAAALPSTPVRW